MHPRQSSEISNPRALVSSARRNGEPLSGSASASTNKRHSLVASRAQVEALDRDIAPLLQRQKVWLMSSSAAGPLRISDTVIASSTTSRSGTAHLSSSVGHNGRSSSMQQLASTPLMPPSSLSCLSSSRGAIGRPTTSSSDRCASPHKALLPAGVERPLTGRQQALKQDRHPGSTNMVSTPSRNTVTEHPRLNSAVPLKLRRQSSMIQKQQDVTALLSNVGDNDEVENTQLVLSLNTRPMKDTEKDLVAQQLHNTATTTYSQGSIASPRRHQAEGQGHTKNPVHHDRTHLPSASSFTAMRGTLPNSSSVKKSDATKKPSSIPTGAAVGVSSKSQRNEDAQGGGGGLRYLSLATKTQSQNDDVALGRSAAMAELDTDPAALTLPQELGITVFSDGNTTRCVLPVYDRSNIAQYWLTKAKNMDEFLSARIQLSSSDALRMKVATSVKTVEDLLEELNSKKVTSREQRYNISMRDAVNNIIYEVSRKHLDAAERAKKEADEAEEEERRLAEEEEARQRRIRGDTARRLVNNATSDGEGGEGKDDEDRDGGSGVDENGGDAAATAAEEEASIERKKSRILFNNRRRQQQLRNQRHDAGDDDNGGVPGTSTSFQSNLQTILDTVEAHTDIYHQIMEEEEDDLLDEEQRAASFLAVGDGFDGDGNSTLMYSIRRPSALENDPFALASERAARAGFLTAPGGGGVGQGGTANDRSNRSLATAFVSGDASSPAGGLARGTGTLAVPLAAQQHGGVSSFLNDRSRSFTAGGTCVLPGSITKAFTDVPVVGVSSSSSARRGSGAPPPPPPKDPLYNSVLSAAAQDEGRERIDDDSADDDDNDPLFQPLRTDKDIRREEEATCLDRVALDTVRALRDMEQQRTFPIYLHLQEHPELRPPPSVLAASSRPREEIDVSKKDVNSSDESLQKGGGAGGDSDGSVVDTAAMLARLDHSANQQPYEDAPSRQQQQQKKQKRALDLNNLAKYGEAAKAAAADGTAGGLSGALSFSSGVGAMGNSVGGPRSPRFAMEQNYGVKGSLIDQGSIDGSHDALFGFYGIDPFEIPGILKSSGGHGSGDAVAGIAAAFLGGGGGTTPRPGQHQRPISPVSPNRQGTSPNSASLSPPKLLKTFFKTVRYWVTNLSTTDVLALYITMDPKKTVDYTATAVDALRAPNRPNAYVARVYPMTMLQIAVFEYSNSAPPPADDDVVDSSTRDVKLGDAGPVLEPKYSLTCMVLKREKRNENDRGPTDGADSDSHSQQRSTVSAESSFAHMPSDAFSSRRASRQSQANLRTTSRETTEQAKQHQAIAEKEKQERAEKLRQAMILNQKKNTASTSPVPKGETSEGADENASLKSRTKSTTKRSRRLSNASTASVTTLSGSGGGPRRSIGEVNGLFDDSTLPPSRRPSVAQGVGVAVSSTTSPHTEGLDGWKTQSGGVSSLSDPAFVPKRKGKTPKVDDELQPPKKPPPAVAVTLDDHTSNLVDDPSSQESHDTHAKPPLASTTTKPMAPASGPIGKIRKRGGSHKNRRGRSTSVTLVTETSPLFTAEGIEATVTTEDELLVPREGEGNDIDDEDDEGTPVVGQQPKSSLVRRVQEDEQLDEAALYEALFSDDADDSIRDHRTSSGSVRSGLGVSVDSAGSPLDGDPALDGSQKGSPDAQSGRRHTESFHTVEALLAQRRATNTSASGGVSITAEDISPAKRALLARKSIAAAASSQSKASPTLSSAENDASSFESAVTGASSGVFAALGAGDATSFSIDERGGPDGHRGGATIRPPTASSGVDEELANVLSSVAQPRAVQVLKDEKPPTRHKKTGGKKKQRGNSTASQSPTSSSRTSPQHSVSSRMTPPPTTVAVSKIFAVAERADRKNAILEGVLRSAAEQDALDRATKVQNSVSPRSTVLTPPLGGASPSHLSPLGGEKPSNTSSVDVDIKTSFAMDTASTTTSAAQPALSVPHSDDLPSPASALMSSFSRRSSGTGVPPPPPVASGVPKFSSTSFASSSVLDGKTPRGPQSSTASPQFDASTLSPTSPQLGTTKTFTEVIRERLEDLAAKVAGEGLSPRRGNDASSSLVTSPISPRNASALPTVDDLLAGTELQSVKSPVRSCVGSATLLEQQQPQPQRHTPNTGASVVTSPVITTIPTAVGGSVVNSGNVSPMATHTNEHQSFDGVEGYNSEAVENNESSTTPPSQKEPLLPQSSDKKLQPPSSIATSDRELRLLFEEDPDAFSDVITDLAENAAARIMQEVLATEGRGGEEGKQQPPRASNPASHDAALMDTPPPLSDQLNTYTQYVPPPTEDPEVLRRERAKAQRLLAEQKRLDALVAEIVGQVSRLWPTVQAAPTSRRAEFFQTSMEVAWRAQKKRAINVGKLISMLDRKVSARGWYPRYDHRDELRDGSDDDSSDDSDDFEGDDDGDEDIASSALNLSGAGGGNNTLTSLVGSTASGGGRAIHESLLLTQLSSTIPTADNTGVSPRSQLSPRPTFRRKRSNKSGGSKRNAGGATVGKRRGSATTLHRALSEIAQQHRQALAAEEHARAVQKEQHARHIQEQEATNGGVGGHGEGGVIGVRTGSVRFRSHRFTHEEQDVNNGGRRPPPSGWEEAEGLAMAPLLAPDHFSSVNAPVGPLSSANHLREHPQQQHRVSFATGTVGAHGGYNVIHLPHQPGASARPVPRISTSSLAVASGRSFNSNNSVNTSREGLPHSSSQSTYVVKSQHHVFDSVAAQRSTTRSLGDGGGGGSALAALYDKLQPREGYQQQQHRVGPAGNSDGHDAELPHQLRFGESFPRHALEELPLLPSAALAYARIQNIRKHRLTYHLALRTGLIRD